MTTSTIASMTISDLLSFILVTFMINASGHAFSIFQLKSSIDHSNTSCHMSLYRRIINPNKLTLFSDGKRLNMQHVDEVSVEIGGNYERSSVMDRSSFFHSAFIRSTTAVTAVGATISSEEAKAIEFIPASPSFKGTYQDAIEILYTQRIALDNIQNVISNGKIDEAGFKVMQLSAQTRTAGKIVLDTLQEQIVSSSSADSSSTNNSSITLLRYLSCQKKFAMLIDVCDECGITLQNALKGKLGVTTTAQIKVLAVVDETMRLYDDFLADVKFFERSIRYEVCKVEYKSISQHE